MAVQAQYPSNVLLLNRNGQDRKNTIGNDYSLQPQSGGFLDQSHMFFNNGAAVGATNPRKRGREAINGGTASTVPINLFSLQPQQQPLPTLVNLAQLHNQQQPNVVSTGLRLAFEDQQHLHQQQRLQQQQQQNLLPSTTFSPFQSEELYAQMKQQRDEIDQFLQAQGEQLRRTLAERRQRHYHALLGAAEESASRRLREKETEVEKAARKNAELQERMAQLRMEAQVWQAKARAQEATVTSLQAQLQQALVSGAQDRRDDGLSCAGDGGGGEGQGQADDAESAYIDPERVVPVSVSSASSGVPMCKACRIRAASVVLLPCRHLCLCTECDTAVEACPLCLSYRDASVEVFLS